MIVLFDSPHLNGHTFKVLSSHSKVKLELIRSDSGNKMLDISIKA